MTAMTLHPDPASLLPSPEQGMEVLADPTIVFTAHFVDDPEALIEQFGQEHENVFAEHCTIQFRPPDGVDSITVGEKQVLEVTGRVTTSEVDVLIVEGSDSTNSHPHITLSTAEDVQPFKSKAAIERAIEEGTVLEASGEIATTTKCLASVVMTSRSGVIEI